MDLLAPADERDDDAPARHTSGELDEMLGLGATVRIRPVDFGHFLGVEGSLRLVEDEDVLRRN